MPAGSSPSPDLEKESTMPLTSLNTAVDIANSLNPWLARGRNALLAVARLQGQGCKTALRYQIEALVFLKHRFEKDITFLDDLVAAKELDEVLDVYSGFCATLMSDYTNEAGKTLALGSRFAADAARQVRKETGTIAEELAA